MKIEHDIIDWSWSTLMFKILMCRPLILMLAVNAFCQNLASADWSNPETSKFRTLRNASTSTNDIVFSFHSINRIFEVINSAYAPYQTMKIWNFSATLVVFEYVDEVEV